MKVRLHLTCLADAFMGEIGIATVRVLEHAGCQVEFDPDQTCCGQPAFNMGDHRSARAAASRCLGGTLPLVVPSSSCASMMLHGFPMLGLKPPPAFELTEFLRTQMGVTSWPLRSGGAALHRKVVFHRACHGRQLGLGDYPLDLLRSIRGITVVEPENPDQCCGFGGSFCATHPNLSGSIGREKLRTLLEAGGPGATVVSLDGGCLLHLKGLMEREGVPLQVMHIAQVLADAIG